jgi:hypothetical protein
MANLRTMHYKDSLEYSLLGLYTGIGKMRLNLCSHHPFATLNRAGAILPFLVPEEHP